MARDLDGDDPLAAALDYATRFGWRVIPIPRGAKHPDIVEWQRKGTTEAEQIIAWWDALYRGAGIGILTGPDSGLVVIDVDEHGAESGSDTLADLQATYGALPETAVVLTGGGGAHYYFRYPAGVTIRNDAGIRLGPGIDIRADGGQVVAPPSEHANGRHYTWEASQVPTPSDSGLFSEPDEVPIADLPVWMVELLTAAPPEREHRPAAPAGERRLPGQLWAAETDWGDLLSGDGATFIGTRTDAVDGSVYELWARPGIGDDHASASLFYRGSDVLKVFSTNWPGLTAGETYTKFGYYAATRHGGNFSDARADIAAQGYAEQQVRLEDFVRGVREETADDPLDPDERLARDGVRPLAALFDGDAPEYDWVVPGLIERGDRVMLTGDEGHGKSTLLRQMGLCAAMGVNPFATIPENREHPRRRVLYVDCENSERQLRREFPKNLGPLQDVSELSSHFFVSLRTAGIALDDRSDREGDRDWLIRICTIIDPHILILGPLYKLLAGDPNAEVESRTTALFLDELRREARMALLIEAHAPHGAKRPFGWSGWKRWPEFGMHLSDDHSLIPFRGGRDDQRVWPMALRRGNVATGEFPWMPVERHDEADAKTTYEANVRLLVVRELRRLDRPMPAKAISERIERRQSAVVAALRRLEDDGWVETIEMTMLHGDLEQTIETFRLDPDGPAGRDAE